MTNQGDRRTAVIIEDDIDIRHLLETVLSQAGFEVIPTGNGLDGIKAVRAYDPVVVTLDVSMPGMDGLEAAKRIRGFSSAYIVMLTALNEEIDILQGLESGADDYITKPFRPRELRARIEAMLRRPRAGSADEPASAATAPPPPVAVEAPPVYQQPAPQQPARLASDPNAISHNVGRGLERKAAASAGRTPEESAEIDSSEGWLSYKGLRLNSEFHITEVDGVEVDLTRSEFELLESLLESGRRVRSKADLALMLRGESYVTTYFVNEADKRAVEVHMANLRRKVGDSSATPRWIETVRGVGYRLAADDGS